MELEVLGDRYEMQEPIGRGGMATIYRAVDLRMGRTVAVKILREVYSTDPKFVTRFQREARAASCPAAPQHRPGLRLRPERRQLLHRHGVRRRHGPAPLPQARAACSPNERAVEIAHDVALGLGAAHRRGIVHRDVKPQNIMLNDDGLVKLTDFGIASMYKDADAERLTTTGMTLGTVQYYAPEQAQGEMVTPAADIYALGIVMYEMLAGQTPFDGDTPVAVAMRHIQDMPEPPSAHQSAHPARRWSASSCAAWRRTRATATAMATRWPTRWRISRARRDRPPEPSARPPYSCSSPRSPCPPQTGGRARMDAPQDRRRSVVLACPVDPGRGGRPTSQPFPERSGMGYGGRLRPRRRAHL